MALGSMSVVKGGRKPQCGDFDVHMQKNHLRACLMGVDGSYVQFSIGGVIFVKSAGRWVGSTRFVSSCSMTRMSAWVCCGSSVAATSAMWFAR